MIGIIGGTIYDTEIGVRLFKQNSITCKGYVVSKLPEEQDLFQKMNFEYQSHILHKIFLEIINDQICEVVIFCNSLTFSIDFEYFKIKYDLTIYHIKKLLENLDIGVRNMFLLTANESTFFNIKNFYSQKNRYLNIQGFHSLGLIKKIEQGIFDFKEIKIAFKQNIKNDAMMFIACTHYVNYYQDFINEYPVCILESGHFLLNFVEMTMQYPSLRMDEIVERYKLHIINRFNYSNER